MSQRPFDNGGLPGDDANDADRFVDGSGDRSIERDDPAEASFGLPAGVSLAQFDEWVGRYLESGCDGQNVVEASDGNAESNQGVCETGDSAGLTQGNALPTGQDPAAGVVDREKDAGEGDTANAPPSNHVDAGGEKASSEGVPGELPGEAGWGLSPQAFAAMSEALSQSAALRRRYLEHANLMLALRETAHGVLLAELGVMPTPVAGVVEPAEHMPWEDDRQGQVAGAETDGQSEPQSDGQATEQPVGWGVSSDASKRLDAKRASASTGPKLAASKATSGKASSGKSAQRRPGRARLILNLGVVQVYRDPNAQTGWPINKMAAALFVVFTGVWLALLFFGAKTPPPVAKQPDKPLPPPVQATIDWGLEASWQVNGRSASYVPSQVLGPGHYELSEGFAGLTLDTGVDLILQAPCEFELDAANQLSLTRGRITADVPEPAIGFAIVLDGLTVTDLGTQFAVDRLPNGQSLTAVYQGKVALADEKLNPAMANAAGQDAFKGKSAGKDASAATMLTAGQQVEATAQGKLDPVKPMANPMHFVTNWQEAAQRPRQMLGDIVWLPEPPVSVDVDAFERVRAVCFLEQARLTVPENLAMAVTRTGMTVGSDLIAPSDLVARGKVVDSYFVHFDPPGKKFEGTQGAAHFSITMPRPIVAVIPTNDGLQQSQQWLQSSQTTRPDPGRHPNRSGIGLESNRDLDVADAFAISDDRRTITAKLQAGPSVDQFRILIEPAEIPPANVDTQQPLRDDDANSNDTPGVVAGPVAIQ